MAAPQLAGTPAAPAVTPGAAPQPTPGAGVAVAEELEEEEEELGAEGDGAPGAPVVGHRGQPMSDQAISDRLARAQRNWNRKTYGTADPDKIAQIQAQRAKEATELAELRAKNADFQTREEAAKQAQMTDLEKVTADRDKFKTENEQLKQQLKTKDTELVSGKQDVVITQHAAVHLDPEALELAKFKLQQHLKTLKPAELAAFTERKLDRWFKDYAEKFPKFAKQAAVPAVEETEEQKAAKAAAKSVVAPVRQVPVTAPRRVGLPPKPVGSPTNGSKTIRPGPQQLSKKELDANYRKSTGRKLPW